MMPTISTSDDLRGGYGEVSEPRREYREPAAAVEDGEVGLVEEAIKGGYEVSPAARELYQLLQKSIDDFKHGRTRTVEEVMRRAEEVLRPYNV